jgi:hypothetical protein
MAYNVPAVCDVPAHPIKQTAGLRVGWNVGEGGVGASEATDLASRTLAALKAALHKQSCYATYCPALFT